MTETTQKLPFFEDHEFNCPCGKCGLGRAQMQPDLLSRLVYARKTANIPFVITSAIRCEEHNKAVGGVDSSAHTDGYAVDLAITDSSKRFLILSALSEAGFHRIGIAKTFIHVDCDPRKVPGVVWVY